MLCVPLLLFFFRSTLYDDWLSPRTLPATSLPHGHWLKIVLILKYNYNTRGLASSNVVMSGQQRWHNQVTETQNCPFSKLGGGASAFSSPSKGKNTWSLLKSACWFWMKTQPETWFSGWSINPEDLQNAVLQHKFKSLNKCMLNTVTLKQ